MSLLWSWETEDQGCMVISTTLTIAASNNFLPKIILDKKFIEEKENFTVNLLLGDWKSFLFFQLLVQDVNGPQEQDKTSKINLPFI